MEGLRFKTKTTMDKRKVQINLMIFRHGYSKARPVEESLFEARQDKYNKTYMSLCGIRTEA